MEYSSSLKEKILYTGISISVSIGIGYLISKDISFTKADSVIIAFLSFILLEIVQLVFLCISLFRKQQDEGYIWHDLSHTLPMFVSMAKYYQETLSESHGKYDLFITSLKKEVDHLHGRLRDAAERREITISSDYIINVEGVFDAFNVSPSKVLRLTWPISVNDKRIFETPADARFFEVAIKMLSKKRITSMRIILIIDSQELFNSEMVKKLLDFFASTKSISAKICYKQTYESVAEANGVNRKSLDIGIYGPKMLYITQYIEPQHVGTYTKDEERVKRHTKLYDELWESSHLTISNPSRNNTNISMPELMSL